MNGTAECELDGVRYPLAMHHMRYGTEAQRNQLAFHIADNGESLIERWDDWHLGMGATDHIPGMYYFSAGGDASRYGQVRAPLGYTATATHQTTPFHTYYLTTKSPGAHVYSFSISGINILIQKFSSDMATYIGNYAFVGSGGPGRPAYWGGKWYMVPSRGNATYRLDTDTGVAPVLGDFTVNTWTAICLSTFTAGGTAKIARAYNTNQVALATVAPLSTADPGDWGGGTSIGDTSTAITDMVENQGLLFVAKEDNLYEFDADSIARPVLPFGARVGVDGENGLGMLAFADYILYPSIEGLWLYRVGHSAHPISLDTLGIYSDVSNMSSQPVRFRHRGVVNIGEWIWMAYSDGTNTHLLATRFRRNDDPGGHELVWHAPCPVIAQPGKALGLMPSSQLVVQAATTNASLADQSIQLSTDGSPASFTGTRGTGGQFVMGETDFGRPTKRKQLITAYLDMDAAVSVDVRGHRDGGAVETVGNAAAAGLNTINFTAGTNDKCTRYRPNLQINGATAAVRKLIIEARTPSVYRVVIDGSDEALRPYGLSAEDARTNLMRLVNKGLINVIGPAGVADMTLVASVPTAWQGYVEALTEIVYQTDSGIGHGFELRIARYTTDGN